MSSNSCSVFAAPATGARSTTTLDADAVFTAFNDDDCLCILRAISDESLSATEIHDRHGLPLSTTYRKLELLDDAGLVEESIRLSSTGHHTSEYTSVAEDVLVRIEDGGVSVSLVADRPRATTGWR